MVILPLDFVKQSAH